MPQNRITRVLAGLIATLNSETRPNSFLFLIQSISLLIPKARMDDVNSVLHSLLTVSDNEQLRTASFIQCLKAIVRVTIKSRADPSLYFLIVEKVIQTKDWSVIADFLSLMKTNLIECPISSPQSSILG
jgi:hypothetical protein